VNKQPTRSREIFRLEVMLPAERQTSFLDGELSGFGNDLDRKCALPPTGEINKDPRASHAFSSERLHDRPGQGCSHRYLPGGSAHQEPAADPGNARNIHSAAHSKRGADVCGLKKPADGRDMDSLNDDRELSRSDLLPNKKAKPPAPCCAAAGAYDDDKRSLRQVNFISILYNELAANKA